MEKENNVVLTNVYGDVCIRKARRKRQKLLVRQLMYDYADNTTLHGLPYLTRSGLTFIEKIFWLITFLLSVALCLYSISQVWVKWRHSPVIVTVSEQQLPVSTVPFPSVTICPQSKCLVRKYNYTAETDTIEEFLKSNISDSINSTMRDRIHKVAAIKQICNEVVYFEDFADLYPYNYSDSSILENILQVAPDVKNIFLECTFRGKEFPCQKFFKKVVTAEGICFNMNSLAEVEILRRNELKKNYTYLYAVKPIKGWSVENGYSRRSINSSDKLYPYPGAENGKSPDLEVVLRESLKNRDESCNSLNSGYRVYVQHPTDLPQSSLYYYAILNGQVSSMAISLTALTTSERLRGYDAELRQCYFPGEKYLKYFNQYTEKNCRLECLSNTTFNTCGCVKFHMPHESTSICSVKNEECVTQALKKIQFPGSDNMSNASCYCLPSCNSVEYEAEILKTEYNLRNAIETFGKRKHVNFSLERYVQSPAHQPIQNCQTFPFENELYFFGLILSIYQRNLTDRGNLMCWPPYNFTKCFNFSKLDMYFKKPRFLMMRRSEVFGVIDFFANCGGLLGLFMGFSFLSLIEIFYFLTLRLCCTLKKDLEEEKDYHETKKIIHVKKY